MSEWIAEIGFPPGLAGSAELLVGLAVAAVAGFVVAVVVVWILRRVAHTSHRTWDDRVTQRTGPPIRFLGPVVALLLFFPLVERPGPAFTLVRHALSLALIGGVGWLLLRATGGFRDAILEHWDIGVADNLKAREVYTQVEVVGRILSVLILFITFASMVMTFDRVRQIGVSLLASAGIAGIILGFAAQKSLSTLLAGIQIALTQPIRIDDVVIVEGEWGRVEEIKLTYVVIRIWDLRRLVVPIGYFIEKPFQNWTRVSADLLGAVVLHTDFNVPLGPLRAKVEEILKESSDWNGEFWNVQVTGVTERTMEVRILMSAADSGKAWNLRCAVRERILLWLAENHPGSLPRTRAEITPFPGRVTE